MDAAFKAEIVEMAAAAGRAYDQRMQVIANQTTRAIDLAFSRGQINRDERNQEVSTLIDLMVASRKQTCSHHEASEWAVLLG